MLTAISSLERLSLDSTSLTAGQLSALFSELSSGGEALSCLNLSNNDLSSVPTETLLGALSSLEEAQLYNTRLTGEQIAGIRQLGGKWPVLSPASLRGN